MPWKDDLAFGKAYELLVPEILEHEHEEVMQTEGNVPEYDIRLRGGGQEVLYESKADRKAVYTGNIVIEFEKGDGTPSGIQVTTAAYWVYWIHKTNIAYIIPVDVIKAAITDKLYDSIKRTWNSKMYCFPTSFFDDYRIEYDMSIKNRAPE